MTPEQKFHSYVTSLTVLIMYFLIEKFTPYVNQVGNSSDYIKPIVSILSAFGIYTLLAQSMIVTSRNLQWLNKFLLGASYMNGTWVGKFVNTRGEVKITVEFFEQNISSLTISGQAFNEDGSKYAKWNSVASSINAVDGILTYTYNCDPIMDSSNFRGIGVFQFERKGSHLPPTFIDGYSVDVNDGAKSTNREKKISDDVYELQKAYPVAVNHAKSS
jgi:hypothetical protein